jgi:hypothetical protein
LKLSPELINRLVTLKSLLDLGDMELVAAHDQTIPVSKKRSIAPPRSWLAVITFRRLLLVSKGISQYFAFDVHATS